ncbi:hypothetical protein AHF37_05220 [Paragonimus kellicotti]|nr:hypothetical protein AHF37_05220 [Paragonimus kellicotti]
MLTPPLFRPTVTTTASAPSHPTQQSSQISPSQIILQQSSAT